MCRKGRALQREVRVARGNTREGVVAMDTKHGEVSWHEGTLGWGGKP
jgi:hypothetical protein